jgi:hypothetical protein
LAKPQFPVVVHPYPSYIYGGATAN